MKIILMNIRMCMNRQLLRSLRSQSMEQAFLTQITVAMDLYWKGKPWHFIRKSAVKKLMNKAGVSIPLKEWTYRRAAFLSWIRFSYSFIKIKYICSYFLILYIYYFMFYFLRAIVITFSDLFYIKMWLRRGQPYPAFIGDHLLWIIQTFCIIRFFLGSTINMPCFKPLFF